ncbi:MAG: MgtC/SapB family protein [Chitinivibrionales bacterium]|nr:MgtC/SapB family protein [Chitinivibrionales bacterium]
MDFMPQLIVLGKTAVAMFFGGLIGLERELGGKQAGLRTHMIIAAASALLMGLSDLLVHRYQMAAGLNAVNTIDMDPMRIMQGLIMGISVFAGGAIIRDKSTYTVKGLTSMVSLLLSGGIGIAIGAGQFILGGGIALLGIIVLLVFHRFEKKIRKDSEMNEECGEE